jgi:hypothetical protein
VWAELAPDREERLNLLNLAGNNFAAFGQDHSAVAALADVVGCMRSVTCLNLIANGIQVCARSSGLAARPPPQQSNRHLLALLSQ